jgi:hypothetical protein
MRSTNPTTIPNANTGAGDNPLLDYPCVETGVWTPIPKAPPKHNSHRLKLKEIDPKESKTVKERGSMTFHAVGCSGCFENPHPGLIIGNAMATQADDPKVYGGDSRATTPSFFYHLGDVVYKAESQTAPPKKAKDLDKDEKKLYATQFFAQYDRYKPNIFAIPGNHDSKSSQHGGHSASTHFLDNFCDLKRRPSPDGGGNWRKTMKQPYPYWLLQTPVAYIIGLATNDLNGGQLDDPMGSGEPQYQWFVDTLDAIKAENQARSLAQKAAPKAVLLALHYPPFSGSANFAQRGNPNLGPTPRPNPRSGMLLPLGMILHRAFHQTQQYPDAVLSAHAHLYQRITYTLGSGRQIPYVIAGSGGHGPVEKLTRTCWEKPVPVPSTPFDVVLPPGLTIPAGDKVQVVSFNQEDFGFLRVTVNAQSRNLTGEFFATSYNSKDHKGTPPKRKDCFILDLDHHTLQ